MKLIYLASPYSHVDKAVEAARFQAACLACAELFKRGYAVYSPIVHWHCPSNLGKLDAGFEVYEQIDREMIKRCDELWLLMLDGVLVSKGVASERRIAMELGKPIRSWVNFTHKQKEGAQ